MYFCDEKGDIKLYDRRENKVHLKFCADIDINCARLCLDQKEIFYGDSNGMIGRLDLRAEQHLIQKLKAYPNDDFGIHSLCLTGDSKNLIFGDSGGNIIYASLENNEEMKIIKKNKFHTGIVMNCEISKNKEYLVTSSTDHSMKIFSLEEEGSMKELHSINQHNGWVWGLQILMDSKMCITASSDSYLTIWDLKNGKLKKEVENDLAECLPESLDIFYIFIIQFIYLTSTIGRVI